MVTGAMRELPRNRYPSKKDFGEDFFSDRRLRRRRIGGPSSCGKTTTCRSRRSPRPFARILRKQRWRRCRCCLRRERYIPVHRRAGVEDVEVGPGHLVEVGDELADVGVGARGIHVVQPSSLSPWKYQSDPLSAMMSPYFLQRGHDDLRRGAEARRVEARLEPQAQAHRRVRSCRAPLAACVAGRMYAVCVLLNVTRIACVRPPPSLRRA